jgi:ABC-type multidrug transport system permease subunit
VVVGLAVGVAGLLLCMPLNNSCILNFDRSVKPAQLAGPDENPFGMVVCDNFEGLVPSWLLAVLLVALLCVAGGIAARFASAMRVVIGGVTSGGAMLLAFLVGGLVYPWIEAYWMPARDLFLAVPIAALCGAFGGLVSARWPNKTIEPTR